jgi:signal transduction histidine kinase
MSNHRAAGHYFEAQRRTLAEAVVARQYQLDPELPNRYGDRGRQKCIQDTEYHLAYLASAVTFASPILFAHYMAWAKPTMAAYGVELKHIEDNLICLRDVLQEQVPTELAPATVACVELALGELQQAPCNLETFLAADDHLGRLARSYLEALLRGERHIAVALIHDAVRSGISVHDIYLRVFQPCQQEIGRLWQLRQITVAQEHSCTATTQLAMSQLYPLLLSQPRKGRRVVATSVSGELHEIGLRIVTDLFEADGWDTLYLGGNVPDTSIVQTVNERRPDLLLISATMTFHVNAVARLIELIRNCEAGPTVKIMVGGYPCNVDPELWRRVGADGSACDAIEALDVADRLLAASPEASPAGQKTTSPTVVAEPWIDPQGEGEREMFNALTRLNNELFSTQRELARKNSELAQLNGRLMEADRSKDRFLATLAHEMRNPLAPIVSGLELLRVESGNPDLVAHVCDMMERQARHLTRLVDDLLDVSRITSGKIALQKERVELSTIVQSALDAAGPRIEAAGHELQVSLPARAILVEADSTRIAQVISNLLTNAARYTPSGGHIWLTVDEHDDHLAIAVKDTGIGIPPDMLGRIFDMFIQVDQAADRSQSGLGIGLMLVKRLTEMHGGTVEARSEGPGKGSQFIVTLPIVVEALQPSHP